MSPGVLGKGISRTAVPTVDMIQASVPISVQGTSNDFADYEIGLMQTVIDDLTLAEYISGHRVLQKLPVPIRAAQMKGDIPVPQPWMALAAMGQPDAGGAVSLNTGWRMDTPVAPFFNFFHPELVGEPVDFLDTWQRHTSLALWLVARRRAAPLDRFDVIPIDGVVYDLTQNLDTTYRRRKGDLDLDPKTPLGESEFFLTIGGQFRTSLVSESPSAFAAAQFDVPVASDIDLIRQTVAILDAPPAPQTGGLLGGMGLLEYGKTIKQILDNLEVFTSDEDVKQGVNPVKMPRLGFIFAGLDVEIDVDRSTGRIPPSFGLAFEESPVKVKSKGLQRNALAQLSLALALRLSKRDFLGQGRSAVLNREALDSLPGDQNTATFSVSLPALADIPDFGQGDDVAGEMAEMFACTLVTEKLLDSREFGAVYWLDRDQRIHRLPESEFSMSGHQNTDGWQTDLPCDPNLHQAGLNIGTVHTHPEDSDPNPSPGDFVLASKGVCGRRHYVISKFGVIVYNQDGTSHFRQDITDLVKAKLKTAECKQVKSEDFDKSEQ